MSESSWLSRLFASLFGSDARRRWLLGLPLGALVFLLIGAGGAFSFMGFVAYSNTEAFCISCHEMEVHAYAELQESPHHKNRTGVAAICADCHVPKPIVAKMIRKVQATMKELPHHFLGKIDTPEKYEAHRLAMAQAVWTSMKASDSRECRSCHKQNLMDLSVQSRSAQRKHSVEWREKTGDTCIDCHKGVAHHLPALNAANDGE